MTNFNCTECGEESDGSNFVFGQDGSFCFECDRKRKIESVVNDRPYKTGNWFGFKFVKTT